MIKITDFICVLALIYLFQIFFVITRGQVILSQERSEKDVIWCTVNSEEQKKCLDIRDYLRSHPIFDSYGRRADIFNLECNQTYNKDDCMLMLDSNMADLTSLDPGEVFVGGRYHSLIPIIEEIYNIDGAGAASKIYAVALVKKSARINSLRDLRGKRACFAGVGTLAGWVKPIQQLMKDGGMDIVDCNNHVKSAMEFFGPSCSVNSLSDKYNPLGDNSDKLCQICGSDQPGVRCTSNDPYSGYEGALACILDQGEVAFLKHSSIDEFFKVQRDLSQVQNNNNNLDNTFNFNNNRSTSGFPFFFTTSTTTQRSLFPFDFQNQQQQNFSFLFGGGVSTTTRQPFDNFGQGRRFDDGRGQFIDNNLQPGFGSTDPRDRNRNHQTQQPTSSTGVSYDSFRLNYELLCPDGSKRNVEEWRRCVWDEIPAHAIVTSSAKSPQLRLRYQRYLQTLQQHFGSQQQTTSQNPIGSFSANPTRQINLFESVPKYGNRSNLMFQDATIAFRSIPEADQYYTKFLGESLKSILDIRSCPVGRMNLCVTSDAEYQKCIKMRTALNAQLLRPEMSCYKAHSHINCMQAIRNGDADAAVLDPGDVYTAGFHYGLIPVLAEIYNLQEPEFYSVAVAYQGDPDTELTYLKGKYSCHSGIGHAAGWIIPMAYLISSGRMRSYGCDSVIAASQYFTKSCVPGALSNEYNFGEQHSNLCDLCRGSSSTYCSRDASEDFYGTTGSLRCLIEGGGQVAFVRHTSVSEVTDGKRKETWSRNTLSGDYELLCRDGTRAPVTDYVRCNLGKVKSNAVVIRGGEGYNETETNAFINLFLYAQQFYGRKFDDEFNFAMFYTSLPYSDLIFQDATQQLRIIPKEQRNYRAYLGKSFLKARALVDCRADYNRSNQMRMSYSVLATFLTALLIRFGCIFSF